MKRLMDWWRWVVVWRFPLVLSWAAVSHDHSDLVADLLKELSNHNERSEERKGALVELLKITREDNLAVWDEHFKTILLLLLETLSDKDVCYLMALLCVCVCVRTNYPPIKSIWMFVCGGYWFPLSLTPGNHSPHNLKKLSTHVWMFCKEF